MTRRGRDAGAPLPDRRYQPTLSYSAFMPHAHMSHSGAVIGRSTPPTFDRRRLLVTGAVASLGGLGSSIRASSARAVEVTSSPDTVVDDTGVTDLDEALALVPTGGELVVTRPWRRTRPLELDRPMTLRFVGEGALDTTADISVVRVTSSAVDVVGAVVRGPGGRRAGVGRGIDVVGTAERPLDDVRLVGGHLSGLAHDGVRAEHTSGLVVHGLEIGDVGYAGVLLRTCVDGAVRACTVSDVHQPSPYVNSYGIIVTRDDTLPLTVTGRSARLTIEGNVVTGVRSWEGIDTHAGDRIVVRDNKVRDCRVGISIVPCRDEVDLSYRHAPTAFVVAGNTVERITLDTPGAGIVVKGAGSTVGDAAERATGFVTDNVVRGHGGGTEAGVLLYLTRDVVVSGSVLDRCVDRAISLYHSNDAITVTRTVATGLRSSTPGGAAAVVDVRSASNSATVSATRFVRDGGETGPVRGVAVATASNTVDLLANDWSAADLAVWNRGALVRRWADGA